MDIIFATSANISAEPVLFSNCNSKYFMPFGIQEKRSTNWFSGLLEYLPQAAEKDETSMLLAAQGFMDKAMNDEMDLMDCDIADHELDFPSQQ